jgi:hypothetical protein
MSRIDVVKTEVFKFDELSDEGKKKGVENLYDINVSDFEWWDCTYEDATEIAALMGIEISEIYFSGFSSQGDGACFECSYSYQKGGVKAVKDYAPIDKELHQIAARLQAIQRKNFYKVGAEIKHSGSYYHENCTDIQVWSNNEAMGGANDEAYYGTKEALKDFMKWIYRQLERQYDYLTSEEAIVETIEANDYEFTAEGKLY